MWNGVCLTGRITAAALLLGCISRHLIINLKIFVCIGKCSEAFCIVVFDVFAYANQSNCKQLSTAHTADCGLVWSVVYENRGGKAVIYVHCQLGGHTKNIKFMHY